MRAHARGSCYKTSCATNELVLTRAHTHVLAKYSWQCHCYRLHGCGQRTLLRHPPIWGLHRHVHTVYTGAHACAIGHGAKREPHDIHIQPCATAPMERHKTHTHTHTHTHIYSHTARRERSANIEREQVVVLATNRFTTSARLYLHQFPPHQPYYSKKEVHYGGASATRSECPCYTRHEMLCCTLSEHPLSTTSTRTAPQERT